MKKSNRWYYAELISAKKSVCAEYYQVKEECRELMTYQANLAGLFGIETAKAEPPKEHQHEEK